MEEIQLDTLGEDSDKTFSVLSDSWNGAMNMNELVSDRRSNQIVSFLISGTDEEARLLSQL